MKDKRNLRANSPSGTLQEYNEVTRPELRTVRMSVFAICLFSLLAQAFFFFPNNNIKRFWMLFSEVIFKLCRECDVRNWFWMWFSVAVVGLFSR
jgi:hypothetical protein